MPPLHLTGYEPKASDARLRYSVCPFFQASYPPRRRDSLSTSSIEDSRVTQRSWETTCRPTLEDHDSRQPERKRRFLLAYSRHEGSSFAFHFWLLWRDNFAEHLLINSSHEPDTPTKVSCLLLPLWALLISWRTPYQSFGCNFVNWKSTVKIFSVWIFYFALNA